MTESADPTDDNSDMVMALLEILSGVLFLVCAVTFPPSILQQKDLSWKRVESYPSCDVGTKIFNLYIGYNTLTFILKI